MTTRVRIPPDLAPVLELYRDLGHAARKGLWLSEMHTRQEVQDAAKIAATLAKRSGREAP
ncbi:MAG TPA: hypothetical protein VM370_04225 [Candidatus Thermoplasmatota archaeon]|nr:hypothetical protein [Candidatus Thermoplasmatota archaeon]